MTSYSKALTLLGDVKDIEIQRMEKLIVRELASYENICKNAKDAMRHSLMTRHKQLVQQHQSNQRRQRSRPNSVSASNLSLSLSLCLAKHSAIFLCSAGR